MRILTLLFLSLQLTNISGQEIKFSGIHDTINVNLTEFLEQSNFGMITVYYDEKTMKDGHWSYYPTVKFSESITAVNVSTIPNKKNEYNYILILNPNLKLITDTIGPFYDSYVETIEIKHKKNEVHFMKIRLRNPPEQFEPKYTIIEYTKTKNKLIETKNYDIK
ncbi:MAG: hypothetical protein DRJ01_16915 [Bacteroidetes bacterium]|nr:MAG: hypothetical protein DRJ01_16915 [Bacteroidota bacterium]